MNSPAVNVPQQPVTELPSLKLSGSATLNGTDTLTMVTARNAYRTSNKDSVVDLASGWKASEFNIFGDGNGSAADFNKGSSVTVNVAVQNGTTTAPACVGGQGTTAETNNLTLGTCSTIGGTAPSITFTEALSPIGPTIASITPISATGTQTITIAGSGFGTHTPYNGDSPYILIADLTRGWNAGWSRNNPQDPVNLSIGSWTNNQIVINGFTGQYGQAGKSLIKGDVLQLEVWDVANNQGPANCSKTVD